MICFQINNAQIVITDSLDFSAISTLLQGFGTNISNTVYHCDSASVAQFTGSSELPNTNGLLLSSGYADSIANPSTAFCNGMMANGVVNDVDMNTLAGFLPTYDGCILEFDCIPLGDTLLFNYTFASEEYPEFVGSGFNDAFGIFLTGPGYTHVNIATIPGTSIPVTVNNINAGVNPTFYQDNATGQFCGFDGFTLSLTSTTPVSPNQTYHFKIGVADASDQIFDTGVFLEAFSFRSNSANFISSASLSGFTIWLDESQARANVRFNNPTTPETMLEVFDMNARCVCKEKIESDVLSHAFSFASFSPGIYSIKISGGSDHFSVQRFLVR